MSSRIPTLVAAVSVVLVTACAGQAPQPDPDAKNAPVKPRVVTEAVRYDTDDPAIWINPDDASKSLIVGTDKNSDGALYVFDLAGKVVRKSEPLRRPNNVDIGYGLELGGEKVDFAVTTEREAQRLRFFRLPDMAPIDGGDLIVFDGDKSRAPMGIAVYTRASDHAIFAIVGGKSGPAEGYLWEYRVEDGGDGRVRMTKVRAFGAYSGRKEIEAIAVDDERGCVYYSDEKYGVHKYAADPDAPDANKELALFGTTGFASDLEGISIYKDPAHPGTGYILVSNQQADTFRIFPREGTAAGGVNDHPLVASVRLSTKESDGSDVTSVPLGGAFPDGLFVAMSTDRTFQYYAWPDVARAAGLAR